MLGLLTAIFVALITISAVQSDNTADKKTAARQLFHATVSARDSLAPETYIQRLEQVISLDRRCAEAFHELGRAYLVQGTIEARRRALGALERAVHLAPDSIDFRYTLAQLHLKRGARGAASRQFRAMMKIDPADARPYYQLALFKEADMLHYREMVSLHEAATIYFYPFAEEDFVEAERLLRTAILLDPQMAEAYHHLAGLYFDTQQYEAMAALLEQGIAHNPSSDLLLFLGLARQQLGNPKAAMDAYQQAMQMLPSAESAIFHSLEPVLPPDSLAGYESAADSTKKQMQRRFWTMRDPLFLTTANERLLEHFGRLAYANLRYSIPEKNIAGWQTDRGKTVIRFGLPRWRVRTRPDLTSTPTGHLALDPSREFWEYGDFRMIFDDRFLNRNYSFAWGDVGETDGKWDYEQKIRQEPERYTFPYGGQRLSLPQVIAQFREPAPSSAIEAHGADSTLLEIYFGMPEALLQSTDDEDGRRFALHRGLFVFDQQWNEIRQWREDRQLLYSREPSQLSDGFIKELASSMNYLIDRWSVRLPPGSYYFSLEVMDKKSGCIGVERQTVEVEDFTRDRLAMSSVVLANAPAALGNADSVLGTHPNLILYRKDEVTLVPSLFRQFHPGTPIYVYYEVYNLTLDANGDSRYRIDNTVEAGKEREGFVARIGKFLKFGERPTLVSSSFESGGRSQTEKLYYRLELLGHRTGQFVLTIHLTDGVSGATASRQVHFELVSPR